MKLTKYTFRTPLFGSIDAEELISDTDGLIELSPEQMCSMYDKGPELLVFLSENAEDLAWCVPEEISNIVLRTEFGECAMVGGKMYLRTYIWTEEDAGSPIICKIMDWITEQMSDGWGKSLEQRAWKEERVRKPVMHFDEHSLKFKMKEEMCEVSYYVHPWKSDESKIYLEDAEDVEEEVELSVVATMSLPFRNRQVVKLPDSFALRMFLKDFGRPDIASTIEDTCPIPNCSFYLVRDFEGESGIEILPKWAFEHGSFCSVYDASYEDEIKSTQMPVSEAVLELLK